MLTLQFLPYNDLQNLTSENKIKRILTLVRENKILLVEGRLSAEEETQLIEKTMEEVSKSFKGIEICSIDPSKINRRRQELSDMFKDFLTRFVLKNRTGLTIIGPASIVREIRRDPNKIELLTGEIKRRKRRK